MKYSLSPFIFITCNFVYFIFIIHFFHTENLIQFKTSTNKTVFLLLNCFKTQYLKGFHANWSSFHVYWIKKKNLKTKIQPLWYKSWCCTDILINLEEWKGATSGFEYVISHANFNFLYVTCVVRDVQGKQLVYK